MASVFMGNRQAERDKAMTTINGRRVRLLKEDVVGTARNWKPESDWMKVVTDDGTTYMVHYTDKIEILHDDPPDSSGIRQMNEGEA
jgi:hypothetical protein